MQLVGGAAIANMLTGLNIDEYFIRTEPSCCAPLNYLTDALGSTIMMVDSSGTVQESFVYDPFGNNPGFCFGCAPTSNSYLFTGREDDLTASLTTSRLYYYRGRYYSPMYQRFISQDPIGFADGRPNLYTYVDNSPLNLKDPLGLFWDLVPVGPGFQVYYAAHFQDSPTNEYWWWPDSSDLPDSVGVYALPGFSCPHLACRLTDQQFNQYLKNQNKELALFQAPVVSAPNKTCGRSK